jgi:hypothetical protein
MVRSYACQTGHLCLSLLMESLTLGRARVNETSARRTIGALLRLSASPPMSEATFCGRLTWLSQGARARGRRDHFSPILDPA